MYTTTTPPITTEVEKEVSVLPACTNCGTAIALHYCPNCGQKHTEGRLHMRHLFSEFVHNYLGTDSGFFFTTWQMLTRPGLAVNEFLNGKRKPFLKPVQFYLLMLTFYFIVSETLDVNLLQMSQQMSSDLGYVPEQELFQNKAYQKFTTITTQNIKVVFSVMLFVLAWSIRIFYPKKPYTYTELLVFTLYIYSISFLITAFQTAVFALDLSASAHAFTFYAFYLVSNAYLIWAVYQFFGGQGVKRWMKALFSYLACCLIFIMLAGVIGMVVGISYAYFEKHGP